MNGPDVVKALSETGKSLGQIRDVAQQACNEIVYLRAKAVITKEALEEADRFIAGFEDDPSQEGISALLTKIRGAMS